ncbi:MAG TPA: L-aspartate oxidase [Phycisphaerales bacterium]|nr:L-aspartate oxidase [Phycisphaerales bacterium]
MHPLFDNRRYLIPFRSILLPQIFTNTLVIGGGAAGLSSALAASEHGDAILVSKGKLTVSNTAWAQGGIAAVLDSGDSVESHVRDTLEAGAGLCDEDVVRRVIAEGPAAMKRLIAMGFDADRDAGAVQLGREGGHSSRRIVHSHGDATGRELARCLTEEAKRTSGVRVFEDCFVVDLLTTGDGPGALCMGAITWHPRHRLQMIWADATIIAAGGSGALWRETTNPPSATADGLALAYRAGATLADLAFMQFHPTTLYIAGAARLLISEAVRGEGAVLLDAAHRPFMKDVHPLADLAPRDIVTRAIYRQVAAQGPGGEPHVWLDARPVKDFARRFPGIHETLSRFDLDPSKDLIPVNPAAHYMVGGVRTDIEGRTDVPGLYAVGEAACSGLHGANRLASNSLLEALVLGRAAGLAAKEMRAGSKNTWGAVPRSGPVQVISDIPISSSGELDLTDVRSSLRSVMWRHAGVERSGDMLGDVSEMFDFWARYTLDKIFDDPFGWETQNMLLTGALVARSAAWRRETRGCHARRDFPEPSAEFIVHDGWRRAENSARTEPVRGGVESKA